MLTGTPRYALAIAALDMIGVTGHTDLTPQDMAFVGSDKLWLGTDRVQVNRVLSALCYGGLDLIGLPRFPVPAEFIAAVIARHVPAHNVLIACSMLERADWAENMINGVEAPVTASVLCAHVMAIKAGYLAGVDNANDRVVRSAKAGLLKGAPVPKGDY